jgi:hypothetical protein
MTILCDDADTPWKEAVERYFREFMAFYFPDAGAVDCVADGDKTRLVTIPGLAGPAVGCEECGSSRPSLEELTSFRLRGVK